MNADLMVTIDLTPLNKIRRAINAMISGGAPAGPVTVMLDGWARAYLKFIRDRFVAFSLGKGDWAALSPVTILNRRRGPKLRKAFGMKARLSKMSAEQRKTYNRMFQQQHTRLLSKFGPANAGRAKGLARAHAMNMMRRMGNVGALFAPLQAEIPTMMSIAKGLVGDVAILRDTGTLLNALTLGMPGSYKERIPGGIEVGIGGSAGHPETDALTIGDLAAIHQKGNPERHLPSRKIIVPPDRATIDRMGALMERCMLQLAAGA